MEISCGSGADGRGPIGDGHPALALDAGEVHAVKALVALGADCVVYTSQAETRPEEALQEMEA